MTHLKNLLIVAFAVYSLNVVAQSPQTYLAPPSPGSTPQVFAPNIISKVDSFEFGSIFSEDGKYFLYSSDKDIYWVEADIIDTLRP